MVEERFRLRDMFRSLSGRPVRVWPDGVLHHGVRILLVLGLALVIHLLYPLSPVRDMPLPERGTVAEQDVIAEFTFPIFKSEAELGREQADAAASVSPIFDYEPAALDTMLRRIDTFMVQADSAAAADGDVAARHLRELLTSHRLVVTAEAIEVLQNQRQRQILRSSLERAVRTELPQGIARGGEIAESGAPLIRLRRDGVERLITVDSIITAQRFFEQAGRYLQTAEPELADLHSGLIINLFSPSLLLNRAATEGARANARLAVPQIKGEVLRGERIIGAHERMTDAHVERLRAYQEFLTRMGELEPQASLLRSVGAYGVNVLSLVIFGLLLLFYRGPVYGNLRHVLLLGGLIFTVALAGAALVRAGWPYELIPIAFPALIVAALWDGRLALNMTLVLSVLLAGQAPFSSYAVLFPMVVGGAAAALSVRVIRRRAQTWVFIAFIAAAYALAEASLGMVRGRELAEILTSISWTTLNAIASALIAMGFLPLFEAFTRITTDQTLLELADLNRPLLRRLSLEAPGTYAHSISVANLAEAGASAISAHSLLTRVGVYYHDVGKMLKPQYYVENQPQGRNPHDKLKPATSAAIVRGHVLDGLRLAEEAKLPDSVKAFIAEHHGTQPISFFYEKAREASPAGELDPAEFRYPGPRPQSRETAIAMLADSVESATRALPDPTPERIRELVDRIVNQKIAWGQLDDAPLTLGELSAIKEKFASVLSGMFHHRIDYPTIREQPEPAPAVVQGASGA